MSHEPFKFNNTVALFLLRLVLTVLIGFVAYQGTTALDEIKTIRSEIRCINTRLDRIEISREIERGGANTTAEDLKNATN